MPVSRRNIQHKATALIKPNNPQFKASSGWIDKFMRRICDLCMCVLNYLHYVFTAVRVGGREGISWGLKILSMQGKN